MEGNQQVHPAFRGILNSMSQPVRRFRIEADWRGGGFGVTLPFIDEQHARQWAERKCRNHPGAFIQITERGVE